MRRRRCALQDIAFQASEGEKIERFLQKDRALQDQPPPVGCAQADAEDCSSAAASLIVS